MKDFAFRESFLFVVAIVGGCGGGGGSGSNGCGVSGVRVGGSKNH